MFRQPHPKLKFLKKIQKLNIFWRKFILFGIIILLGVTLSFLFVKSFKNSLGKFEKEKFFEELNIQSLKEEMEKSQRRLEEQLKELEEMAEQIPTTTTSTNNQ